MDDQTDIKVIESKPKSHGCLIAFLITFAVIILHIAAIPVLIEIVDHIPRTKDTQTNGQYVVELQATSSPDWPFGSQDGRIVLKDNNNKKICSVDFSLSNDGKSMCESNWNVEWSEESVIVTIMGEEQKDAVYTLYYNGDVSN
jgi:hypothetical protein